MLMSLQKVRYCVFALFQETSKEHGMYLAILRLKINSKKGQKLSETSKQITNDVFPGKSTRG